MSHTKGKLAVCAEPPNDMWYAGITIYSVSGRVRVADTAALSPRHKEDANRIVACWNACEGIPTDLLDATTEIPRRLANEIDKLRRQRDALLAALINLHEEVEFSVVYESPKHNSLESTMDAAKQAIKECHDRAG